MASQDFNTWLSQRRSTPTPTSAPVAAPVRTARPMSFADWNNPYSLKSVTSEDQLHKIDQGQMNLYNEVFGANNITRKGDDYYSKYGLVVGDLGNNPDFVYDKDLSLGSADTHDAYYRSVSNPDFTVQDWRLTAPDFRNEDWSGVWNDNANLRDYLSSQDVSLDPSATDEQWSNALWGKMDKSYQTPVVDDSAYWSNQTFNEDQSQAQIDLNSGKIDQQGYAAKRDYEKLYNELGYDYFDKNKSSQAWLSSNDLFGSNVENEKFEWWEDNKERLLDPNYANVSAGKQQYNSLVDKYKSFGSYDPLSSVTFGDNAKKDLSHYYEMSKQGGFNPILSPTEAVLIDKGNGQYDTWGRYSKYIEPDFDSKYKTWNYYPEADTYDEWFANGADDYQKLGKSAEGYINDHSPSKLNSDLQKASWINDPTYGTGFTFKEENKDDWGYAPDSTMMKLKSSSWKEPLGMVANLVSFIPGFQWVGPVVNGGMAASDGNWAGVAGSLMGMPGVGTALGMGSSTIAGGLSSSIGNTFNLAPATANAITTGGLNALTAGLSGGDPLKAGLVGGLGSYGGSYVGGTVGNALQNPTAGNIAGGLTSSAINQLGNTGKLNPTSLAMGAVSKLPFDQWMSSK